MFYLVLFNDAFNTFLFKVTWRQTYGKEQFERIKEMFYLMMHSTHFYLRLHGVRLMVKNK